MDIIRLLRGSRETIIHELQTVAPDTTNFIFLGMLLKMYSMDLSWGPKIHKEFDLEHITDSAGPRIMRILDFNENIITKKRWVICETVLHDWYALAKTSPLKLGYDDDAGFIPIVMRQVFDEINRRGFYAFVEPGYAKITATAEIAAPPVPQYVPRLAPVSPPPANPEIASIIACELGRDVACENDVRKFITTALVSIGEKIANLEVIVACMTEEGMECTDSSQQLELTCLQNQRSLLQSVA